MFIYDTGLEALPIGGFTGTIPSPTLGQLQDDIRQGKFHLVLAAATGDPRLAWIAAHCRPWPPPGAAAQLLLPARHRGLSGSLVPGRP